MRSRKYETDTLVAALESSRTLADAMRKLGLVPNGGNYRHFTAHLRAAGLDIKRFRKTIAARCDEVSENRMRELVPVSKSFAQLLRSLGLPEQGRAQFEIKRRLQALGIDTSHFPGASWARGETKDSHPALASASRKLRLPDSAVFVENAPVYLSGNKLAARLVALGWKYHCAVCGIDSWREAKLVLHVDHINGIHNDNRLSNLRFLCPNCHSQTETYCRRRR